MVARDVCTKERDKKRATRVPQMSATPNTREAERMDDGAEGQRGEGGLAVVFITTKAPAGLGWTRMDWMREQVRVSEHGWGQLHACAGLVRHPVAEHDVYEGGTWWPACKLVPTYTYSHQKMCLHGCTCSYGCSPFRPAVSCGAADRGQGRRGEERGACPCL